MSLDKWIAGRADRCGAGFAPSQHPGLCECSDSEWSIFVAALRTAARDGVVNQNDVRPLIRGRIAPKRIGRCYSRAKQEGLLVKVGLDESHDHAGKNAGRVEPLYALRSAA